VLRHTSSRSARWCPPARQPPSGSKLPRERADCCTGSRRRGSHPSDPQSEIWSRLSLVEIIAALQRSEHAACKIERDGVAVLDVYREAADISGESRDPPDPVAVTELNDVDLVDPCSTRSPPPAFCFEANQDL